MSNKKLFKKVFDLELSSKKMKEEILKRDEMNNMKNKKVFLKWSLLTTCLIIFLSIVVLTKSNSNTKLKGIETIDNPKYEEDININKLESVSATKIDAEIRDSSNYFAIPYPFKLDAKLSLPDDLNTTKEKILFTKSKDGKYNYINNYIFSYTNSKNDRDIIISFSFENKPIKDYYFSEDGAKDTKINNFNLKLYNYEEIYFTEFEYNGYFFNIETHNLTESEFISLLKSIIV